MHCDIKHVNNNRMAFICEMTWFGVYFGDETNSQTSRYATSLHANANVTLSL